VGTLTGVKTPSRDAPIRLAAAALLVAALAGCSDDGGPSADPPTTTPASPDETEVSTEPPAPTVEPATGPLVREPVATVHVPEGWVTRGSQLFTDAERQPRSDAALEKDVYGLIDLDVDEVDGAMTLDRAAREAATIATTEGKRVADSELGGEPAFVFTTSDNAFGSTDYTTGLARDDRLVVLTFSLLGSDKDDRLALIDSVVASWEWQQ
jgi:hypothetical protein